MLINIGLATLVSPDLYLRIPENALISLAKHEKPVEMLDPEVVPYGQLVKLPALSTWEVVSIRVDL